MHLEKLDPAEIWQSNVTKTKIEKIEIPLISLL